MEKEFDKNIRELEVAVRIGRVIKIALTILAVFVVALLITMSGLEGDMKTLVSIIAGSAIYCVIWLI